VTARAYLDLTKPRLLPLVLFSGLPVLLMAGPERVTPELACMTLLGTALAAGAANALNSYLERERDALMERTASRPLPAGALSAAHALAFGMALGVLGTAVLWAWSGAAAALIALSAILVYVFAYTLWLKPRSRFGVLVGGISGAIAPLIADAAVDGRVGPVGLLLFAIIFVWQPPHFYAIALYRRGEYERAGFQMLPSRVGDEATRRRILLWVAAAVVPVSLAAWVATPLAGLYGVAALALGGWFVVECVHLCRERSDAAARRVFRVSLAHLVGLFSAMLIDLGVTSWLA
jgi:protoheme IX farnesyltransferase